MSKQEKNVPIFYYVDKSINASKELSDHILESIKYHRRGIIIDSGYKAYDIVANYAHDSIIPSVGRVKYIIDPPNKMIQENKDYIKKLLRESSIVIITTNGLDTNGKRRFLKAMFESVIELDITNELDMDFVLGYNTFHKYFTKEHSEKLKDAYIKRIQNQNIQQIYYEEAKELS